MVFRCTPGPTEGQALADMLFVKVSPSGKLPVSFPKMVGQLPLYYNHKNTGRPAEEMVLIDEIPLQAGQTSTGCTSFFLDAGDGPEFPSGYGLSYSTFEYGTPVLSSDKMDSNGNIEVSCTVTNTGKYEVAETIQLYTRDLVASLIRPVKELKAFQKIDFKPGETKTVTFTLNASDLAFHDLDNKLVVEPGDFRVWVAPNSVDGNYSSFEIVNNNDLTINQYEK